MEETEENDPPEEEMENMEGKQVEGKTEDELVPPSAQKQEAVIICEEEVDKILEEFALATEQRNILELQRLYFQIQLVIREFSDKIDRTGLVKSMQKKFEEFLGCYG